MNLTDSSKNGNGSLPTSAVEAPDTASPQPEAQSPAANVEAPLGFATRADVNASEGISKSKLLLLGGGLAVAVLFFVFTAVVGKSPKKAAVKQVTQTQQAKQQSPSPPKGSVTPLMDTPHPPAPDNSGGQLVPSDIRRTRALGNPPEVMPVAAKPTSGGTLGAVPSFAQTQQRWEDPAPYGATPAPVETVQSQQNSLKEPSLIFVRTQTQPQAGSVVKASTDDDGAPRLELTPGTRIQAKLETQISSAVLAPVVAVVEYTYAIGDKVIIPAGALVYGALQQADRSGLVSVKFDEVELIDGAREKIDAVGTGLDLGPIKGNVYGKNTVKNFLVRAASGLGSVLAEVAGNNTSAAFSEDDMLRERLAENIGQAGDSEVTSLNANSRVVVSVPADTKIYVVFTKHEQTPSTLHKLTASNQ
jgi:type IV secretory pathway VirB10-like protein